MVNRERYDISIWEQIRSLVEWKKSDLLASLQTEISNDRSLRQFQGKHPVPWQLSEIMATRAHTWVQRLYDICCETHERGAKAVSSDFNRAIWAFCIQPFIIGESQAYSQNRNSELMELLVRAVGSPPERRNLLKVNQKDCCLNVRLKIFTTWQERLDLFIPLFDAAGDLNQGESTDAPAAPGTVTPLSGNPPQSAPLPDQRTTHSPFERQIEPIPAIDEAAAATTQADSVADHANRDAGRPAPESPLPQQASRPPTPKLPKEKHPPLPAKKTDYSNLMDPAGLTEVQRECYSLKHEYQLSVAAIAVRLNRARKTIQEHIDSADVKVTLARGKDRSRRRRAQFDTE